MVVGTEFDYNSSLNRGERPTDDEDYPDYDDDYYMEDYDDNDDDNKDIHEIIHNYIYKTDTVSLEKFDHEDELEMAYGLRMHSKFVNPQSPQRNEYVIIGSYKELCEIRDALTEAIRVESANKRPKKPSNRFTEIEVV